MRIVYGTSGTTLNITTFKSQVCQKEKSERKWTENLFKELMVEEKEILCTVDRIVN